MGDRVERKLAAILSADAVGYSRLMARDEAGTLARFERILEEIVTPALTVHAGRLVKLVGDGLLLEFPSAVDAVACAIHIQHRVDELNAGIDEASEMRLRIGINVGDVIVDGEDIYGDGVNVAKRIETLAQPGGICLTRAAVDQVRDKVPIRIESKGRQSVKNIVQPLEVFYVFAEVAGTAPAGVPVRPAPAADDGVPTVAVLAFDNKSSDPEQGFFSEGISEDVITDLSKISQLRVIARNSSFAYRGTGTPTAQVAAELGARYVLEGSVRTAGKRVRVTAQLSDAVTGSQIWAERYDREILDIFDVQDELTHNIVEALKVRLSPEDRDRLARRATVSVEAHTLFLRGRERCFRHTRHDNRAARKVLAQAIALEPDYAAAHARIAFTKVIDYVNGWTDDRAWTLTEALSQAHEAVRMDANEAQAEFAFAIASLWSRDLDTALSAAQACLELEPNSAEGHLAKAHAQIFGGSPAEALDTLNAYVRLDPLYPDMVLHFLAEANISLGRYEEAIVRLRERLERDPSAASAYNLIAACCGHLGRVEEAREAWAQARRIAPDYSVEERRQTLPFRNPDDFETRIAGLRKAGVLA